MRESRDKNRAVHQSASKEPIPVAQETRAKDAQSTKLQKIARSVGNNEVQQRLAQGNASREELFDFIVQRLYAIRSVQLRELDLLGNQRKWWKEVSLTDRDQVAKPEPTRWHETARLYQRAGEQLARGAIGQGAKLVKDAMDVEDRTFQQLTSLVQVEETERRGGSPEALESVGAHDAGGAVAMPGEMGVAWDILYTVSEIEDPPNKRRTKDPWWTLEEEEEEEEEEV
ncbi:MAG: hypothetical protein JXX28_05000 [Deltaproteobacteria bacterium]|nr:hypothetical protein [Deltaproteobacteria bacterium]